MELLKTKQPTHLRIKSKYKPGFTKSDKPKSMAFNWESSSFDVNKKF
jgi:hypothetical protein